jgi:hypothetical protein
MFLLPAASGAPLSPVVTDTADGGGSPSCPAAVWSGCGRHRRGRALPQRQQHAGAQHDQRSLDDQRHRPDPVTPVADIACCAILAPSLRAPSDGALSPSTTAGGAAAFSARTVTGCERGHRSYSLDVPELDCRAGLARGEGGGRDLAGKSGEPISVLPTYGYLKGQQLSRHGEEREATVQENNDRAATSQSLTPQQRSAPAPSGSSGRRSPPPAASSRTRWASPTAEVQHESG